MLEVSSSDEEASVRPEAPAKDSSDEEAFFDEEADHEKVPQKSGQKTEPRQPRRQHRQGLRPTRLADTGPTIVAISAPSHVLIKII